MAMVVPSYRAERTAFQQMALGHLAGKESWVPRIGCMFLQDQNVEDKIIALRTQYKEYLQNIGDDFLKTQPALDIKEN